MNQAPRQAEACASHACKAPPMIVTSPEKISDRYWFFERYNHAWLQPKHMPSGFDLFINECFPEDWMFWSGCVEKGLSFIRNVAPRQYVCFTPLSGQHEHSIFINVCRPIEQALLVGIIELNGPTDDQIPPLAVRAKNLGNPGISHNRKGIEDGNNRSSRHSDGFG